MVFSITVNWSKSIEIALKRWMRTVLPDSGDTAVQMSSNLLQQLFSIATTCVLLYLFPLKMNMKKCCLAAKLVCNLSIIYLNSKFSKSIRLVGIRKRCKHRRMQSNQRRGGVNAFTLQKHTVKTALISHITHCRTHHNTQCDVIIKRINKLSTQNVSVVDSLYFCCFSLCSTHSSRQANTHRFGSVVDSVDLKTAERIFIVLICALVNIAGRTVTEWQSFLRHTTKRRNRFSLSQLTFTLIFTWQSDWFFTFFSLDYNFFVLRTPNCSLTLVLTTWNSKQCSYFRDFSRDFSVKDRTFFTFR